MIKALSYTAVVFLLSGFCLVNEPFMLLEKTLDKYMSTQEFSFNYKMSWVCDGKGSNSVNGTYVKKGKDFMLQQGNGRTVLSGGIMLNINDGDKIIIVQRMNDDSADVALFDMLKMEKEFVSASVSSSGTGDKINFVSKANSPLSYISSAEIQLNSSGWIQHSLFTYDTRYQEEFSEKCSTMRIDYVAYKFENIDASPLKLSNYVIISGNEVKASPAYKSYEVISSLNIETE